MSLSKLSLVDFIDEVDSKNPTPGGGSVSALASALGVSLARMVGNLTIGKKKFEALEQEKKVLFEDTIKRFLEYKEQFILLIDEDCVAFNQMMVAYKMPKQDEEDKLLRNILIQKATLHGIEVPFKVANLAYDVLCQLEVLLNYGNKSTISDLGVCILMLKSGVEGAILNVKINLPGLQDVALVYQYQHEINVLLEKSNDIAQQLLFKIHQSLEF